MVNTSNAALDSATALDPTWIAFLLIILGIMIMIGIAMYIFMSFAFMAIGKKTKYPHPGIAWIPAVGPALITSKTAKMHWWPILLLILAFIPYSLIPLLGIAANIAFTVFSIIWLWKTYEKINYPGWWAILYIIPIVGLIFLGIAAWGKQTKYSQGR